jgi:hypothetical protein
VKRYLNSEGEGVSSLDEESHDCSFVLSQSSSSWFARFEGWSISRIFEWHIKLRIVEDLKRRLKVEIRIL